MKEFNQARVNGGSNYDSLKKNNMFMIATLREIAGSQCKQLRLGPLVDWTV